MKNGLSEDYLLVERLFTSSMCWCFHGQASKTGFKLHVFEQADLNERTTVEQRREEGV